MRKIESAVLSRYEPVDKSVMWAMPSGSDHISIKIFNNGKWVDTDFTVDLSPYLTKEDAQGTYQPIGDYALKSDIPSLEGYATEEWVNSRGFLTSVPDNYVTDSALVEALTPYATSQALTEGLAGKEGTFSIGTGLEMTAERVLNVTLDITVFKVVSALPDAPDAGEENKIFLVPAESTGPNNVYTEYLWVNSAWEEFGQYISEVDLAPYLTKEGASETYATKSELQEVQNSVNGKQDTLISGQNIKSIDGETLLGEGDIQIKYPFPGSDPTYTANYFIDADNYDAQKFRQDIKKGVDIILYKTNFYQIYQASWSDGYWWVHARNVQNWNEELWFEANQFLVKDTKYFQTSTDNTLQTTSKTVPGAINELNDKTPVYTTVPTLTSDYTIPANATSREYIYNISIGATAYNITGAEGIKWVNGIAPIATANSTIVVSIMNNLAVWGAF